MSSIIRYHIRPLRFYLFIWISFPVHGYWLRWLLEEIVDTWCIEEWNIWRLYLRAWNPRQWKWGGIRLSFLSLGFSFSLFYIFYCLIFGERVNCIIYYFWSFTMVLKTGSDWLVRLSTGHDSSPTIDRSQFRSSLVNWTGIEPTKLMVRPVNRMNRTVPSEPSSSNFFFPLPLSSSLLAKPRRPHWNPPPPALPSPC